MSSEPPKKHSFWDPVSSHFSNLFSTPLWNTILEPLMQIWSQKAGFWDPFWNPLGPKMAPKTPQERPKPCTKPSREGPKIAQGHFGSRRAFGGPILDPFGTLLGPLWGPFEAQWGLIWEQMSLLRANRASFWIHVELGAHVGTNWSKLRANLRDLYRNVHSFPKIQ